MGPLELVLLLIVVAVIATPILLLIRVVQERRKVPRWLAPETNAAAPSRASWNPASPDAD